jgi:DNA recombination protein RmuC
MRMADLWLAVSLVALLALLLGLAFGWLLWGRAATRALRQLAVTEERARLADVLSSDLRSEQQGSGQLRVQMAAIEAHAAAREQSLGEQLVQLAAMKEALEKEFAGLAERALTASRENFLALANESFAKHREANTADLTQNKNALEGLINPMRDTLLQYQQALGETEKARLSDSGSLKQLLATVSEQQSALKSETAKLVGALKSQSKTRGRWGEQQLRNVLEMAGLSTYSDFRMEVSVAGDDGALRPDVVVRLPGGRQLIIDAKVNFNAYMEASESDDEAVRAGLLANHAKAMRKHVGDLSSKSYWQQFDSADFVVMFIPGEHFLWAAAEQDRDLYDYAFGKGVVLATPATLVALARTVALVWRQEKMSENAKQVADLGRELYKRMRKMGEHFDKLGKHMGQSVESYNKLVGSVEGSVLPQARKFAELDVVASDTLIEPVQQIEILPRQISQGRDLDVDVEATRQLQ